MAKDTDIAKKPNADIDFSFNDSDMMMMMMVVMMVVMMSHMFSPVAQSAQRYFTSQSYEGDLETRILYVTEAIQYWDLVNLEPFTPMVSLFLINRGVNRVFVAINTAEDWMEMLSGETRTISHVGASKRIELIFYRCDPGNIGVIEAEGHL